MELKKLRELLVHSLALLEAAPEDATALDLERHIRAEEEQKSAALLTGILTERDTKLIALEADATERAKLLDESVMRADELERQCADIDEQLQEAAASAAAFERECAVLGQLLSDSSARADVLESRCATLQNELDVERQATVQAEERASVQEHIAAGKVGCMDVFREGDPIVLLGEGWYDVETAPGEGAFRWVRHEARLNCAQLTRSPYALEIDLEPGAATGGKAFELAAYEGGTRIASAQVTGRGKVELELPAASSPTVRELTLHCEKAASAVAAPGDDREMAYRVFSISAVRRPADVVHPAFSVGKGWYALESFSGETFRWAGSEAMIEAAENAGAGVLALEIEPGPGVGSGPFNLKVSVGSQPPMTINVQRRQRIEIPYAAGGGKIKLATEGGGKRVSSDPRILNFRAFSATD